MSAVPEGEKVYAGTEDAPPFGLSNVLLHSFEEDIAADVRAGLSAHPKALPSKYFYDARGSELFERICDLPEYYQTRTEMAILREISGELAASLAGHDIVELGSGSARKIGLLFDAMDERMIRGVRYLPLDVSLAALNEACAELKDRHPALDIHAFAADFTQQLDVLPAGRPKLLILFGSTIGNLDAPEAEAFYSSLRDNMARGDRFLIGLDMVKPVSVLEAAYNDSQGITADFNRNVLRVINRELAADFNPQLFEHRAFYDTERERVEMHLKAKADFSVRIAALGLAVKFSAGESIRTEICRKFERESFTRRIEAAGFEVRAWHGDALGYFSLVDLVRV